MVVALSLLAHHSWYIAHWAKQHCHETRVHGHSPICWSVRTSSIIYLSFQVSICSILGEYFANINNICTMLGDPCHLYSMYWVIQPWYPFENVTNCIWCVGYWISVKYSRFIAPIPCQWDSKCWNTQVRDTAYPFVLCDIASLVHSVEYVHCHRRASRSVYPQYGTHPWFY